MTTYGDFSSLLQLGVGVGIGLSLFRAPVDLRVAKLDRIISGELAALRGSTSTFAKIKRRDLLDLRLRFALCRTDLDRYQIPFMIAAVFGALANLLFLVEASLDKDKIVNTSDAIILLFVSIGSFAIIMLMLEILAQTKLRGIQKQLTVIRTRKAPPLDIHSV